MTAKKVTVETKKAREDRWEAKMDEAIGEGLDHTEVVFVAAIRAAVYAVVPGKQKHKNIAKLLEEGMTAGARAIHRTHK